VTSIGLDHTEYLGSTLEEIAGEKAGIFKRGAVAVIGEQDPTIRTFLAERAHAAGASNVRVVADEVRVSDVVVDESGTRCTIAMNGQTASLRTPLAGRHQAANLAFALTMLDSAGDEFAVSLDQAAEHLSDVRIPGRFEHVGRYIFDVAHNPAGAEVLTQTIRAVAPAQPITVVLCVLRDKDWREMIRVLSSVAARFVFTMAPTAPANRAWDLDEVSAFARDLGVVFDVTPNFAAALEAPSSHDGTLLITGSFHTVGDAMAHLQVSPVH
jgi:dihydrofolate synthase/folylpolyglutamate synthase